jgi:hypothetical protein
MTTEPKPAPGEIRIINGHRCRFIERELEGDSWEVLGLATDTPNARPVKARPILFTGTMIRALLDGRKTQTRQIVKGDKPGQPLDWLAAGLEPSFVASPDNGLCPYGVPGDLLWARETWCPAGTVNGAAYCADAPAGSDQRGMGWRPSIHMPRWANRLTLEITEVRVERLQDISEADALAEGMTFPEGMALGNDPIDAYARLWGQINGEGSWAANPWCWALTFTVHQQNVDAFLKAREEA